MVGVDRPFSGRIMDIFDGIHIENLNQDSTR